jgi:putative membrane protein
MKNILRHYIITLFVLWVVDYIIPGLSITGGPVTYAFAAAVLFLLNIFIKPILKIILLPISVVTLGLTGIFINTLIFFGLDYFMEEITVLSWDFNGTALAGYSIPAFEFGIIATYVVSAIIISFLITFMRWL